MKNILKVFLAFVVLSGLNSCNMDLKPIGSIDSETAIRTIKDIEKFHTGFYVSLRGYTSGTNISSQELQSDFFHATLKYGNRGGQMYKWQFTVADGDAEDAWGGAYIAISNLNYTIEKASLLDIESWSESDKAAYQRYIGEAYFLRAFYHHQLAMRFCVPYDKTTAANVYGVPYITSYAPTSDNKSYPTRGTLEETYQKIYADLNEAQSRITLDGSVGSEYITADAVAALKARVALHAQDYDTVIKYAQPLLATYPLVANQNEMDSLWVKDSGQECILQLWGELPSSLPGNSDYGYIGEDASQKSFSPDYVPEKWVVAELYQPTDMRFVTFFELRDLSIQDSTYKNIYLFEKFNINPEFQPSANSRNYNHKNKVFRVAEMHLALAEAYARKGLNTDACRVLNDFRKKRDAAAVDVSADKVLDEILNERAREFIGEGFRLNDLRRFKTNVRRREGQNKAIVFMPDSYENQEIAIDNFRSTWPIPQSEMDANPQMKQNEGYN